MTLEAALVKTDSTLVIGAKSPVLVVYGAGSLVPRTSEKFAAYYQKKTLFPGSFFYIICAHNPYPL